MCSSTLIVKELAIADEWQLGTGARWFRSPLGRENRKNGGETRDSAGRTEEPLSHHFPGMLLEVANRNHSRIYKNI